MNPKQLKTCIALLAVMAANTSKAQVLVTPTLPDRNWVTRGNTINAINTALIDAQSIPSTWMPVKPLAACAFSGSGVVGANQGGVTVLDVRSGTINIINYPLAGRTMVSAPDVVIGHDSSGSNRYSMAVGFINDINQVQIDFFRISYTGVSTFTVTYMSSSIVPYSGGLNTPLKTVHLDVVADYNNLSYSLPTCERFFVTFDAYNPPTGAYNVFAAYGSLSTRTIMSTTRNICTSTSTTTDGWQPDVAGIQFDVSGVVHDVAYFTFVDQGGRNVFKVDWDVNANTFTGPTILDNNTNNGTFLHPRIDANDDENNNTGTGQYKVVCEYNDFVDPQQTETLDDIGGPNYPGGAAFGMDLSSLGGGISGPAYEHHLPAIAFGQNGSSEYMVTDAIYDISGVAATFYTMEPILVSTPTAIAPDPSSNLSYFLLNSNYPDSATNTNYANAVSTPCNNVNDTTITAWTRESPAGTYKIAYKASKYMAAGTGFNYRHAAQEAVKDINTVTMQLFPNPVTESLHINTSDERANHYRITNMHGQVALNGYIANCSSNIDVRSLAPGSYTISLYRNGTAAGSTTFVKK